VSRLLDGAFSLNRTPAATPAVAVEAEPAPAPGTGAPAATPAVTVEAEPAPAPGTGDDVSASPTARLLAGGLLVGGVLLAVVLDESDVVAFKPREGFALFAGFYIAAQAIERLLELVPAGTGSKKAKANRAVIFPTFGFILAVLLAEKMGLFYVQAVGVANVSKNWDIILTALAIGGGTKPLHDAIKRIEKAKETPPTTT